MGVLLMAETEEWPELTVAGEGLDAEVKCPSCGGTEILYANDETEYGYVRGLAYDGQTLRIKITDHDGHGSRFWCADCETNISTEGWDIDYV